MADMTALRAHRRGGPEVLVVERAPVPAPADGEVLVAVHAAAITFDELTWEETWSHASFGAEVATTVRSDVAALMHELGASTVIDTRIADFGETHGVYDVVIDTVGGAMLERAFAALRRGGRVVTLSAPPPAGMADEYGVQATFFIVEPNRSQLTELATWVDSSRLHVPIADTFPLARGREAFEGGRASHRPAGKTVLVVRD